jgi:hypothetical protein
MPKQENTGLRARIPAAVAAATAATMQQAARLLERASQAVPLRRVRKEGEQQAPQPGPERSRNEDTH